MTFYYRTLSVALALPLSFLLGYWVHPFMSLTFFVLLSVALDAYVFKIKKYRESTKVDEGYIQKEHNMTLEELDKYADFSTNVQLITLGICLALCPVVYLFTDFLILKCFFGLMPLPYGFIKRSVLFCSGIKRPNIFDNDVTEEDDFPRNSTDGLPGFNSLGVPSASTTAVGGCCD